MKFDVEKSALIEPLQRVVNVLERRQTLPILSHVLIECSESGIVLVGTDPTNTIPDSLHSIST